MGALPVRSPNPKQRPVHRPAAVKPGGGAVHHDLVEVVVAVPLQQVAGNPGVVDHGPHQLGHAPGQGGAGIGHAVAHGVAQAELDVDAALFPQLHQLQGKGHAKAVDVGPGDVFQMAPGFDPHLQGRLDDAQVLVQGLAPVPVELQKDMIVRHGGEDAGLLEAHLLHQGQVFGMGPDPAGDLRKGIAPLPAAVHGFLVFVAVEKKLALPDDPLGPGEPVEQVEDVDDLLHRIRRPGLLAVPEGGVGEQHVLGGRGHDEFIVEIDAGHLGIGKDIPHQIGLIHLLQAVLPVGRVLVIQ